MMSDDHLHKENTRITHELVKRYSRARDQIATLERDLDTISRKKPDSPLNKFKIGLINELLESVNPILGDEFRPFKDFLKFDESHMTTASDAVVMLSQYLSAMDRFRNAHQIKVGYETRWNYEADEESAEEEFEEENEEDDQDADDRDGE